MIDPDLFDLIHREIDGETSPQESERLHQLMEKDAEARTLFRQLREMTRLLNRVEEAEPPPTLRPRVLRALSQRRGQTARQRPGFAEILAAWKRRFTPQLGLAFAAGAVVALALFLLISPRLRRPAALDVRDLTGTLLRGAEESSLAVVETVPFSVAGAEGSLTVRSAEQAIWLDLSLQSGMPTDFRLQFAPTALRLQALSVSGGGAVERWEIDGGILLRSHQGRNRVVLVFQTVKGGENLLQFQLIRGDRVLFEKSVSVQAAR